MVSVVVLARRPLVALEDGTLRWNIVTVVDVGRHRYQPVSDAVATAANAAVEADAAATVDSMVLATLRPCVHVDVVELTSMVGASVSKLTLMLCVCRRFVIISVMDVFVVLSMLRLQCSKTVSNVQ